MTINPTDPYEVLVSFQDKEGVSSLTGDQNPQSQRLRHLRGLLSHFGLCEVLFGDNNKRVNLWGFVRPFDESRQTTILLAHHDTVRPGFDTLDNTASVSVILAIAYRLRSVPMQRNLIVYFSDGEECGGLGVQSVLAPQIEAGVFGNNPEIINFELCASGEVMVLDGACKSLKSIPEIHKLGLPLSDGVFLQLEGIENVCTITLLSGEQLDQVLEESTCALWKKCHSKEDGLDLASHQDMSRLVDVMVFALSRCQGERLPAL